MNLKILIGYTKQYVLEAGETKKLFLKILALYKFQLLEVINTNTWAK